MFSVDSVTLNRRALGKINVLSFLACQYDALQYKTTLADKGSSLVPAPLGQ